MNERVGTAINMQDMNQRAAFLLIVLRKDLRNQQIGLFTKPRASTIARKHFHLKGNLDALIAQVGDLVDAHYAKGTRFGFPDSPRP